MTEEKQPTIDINGLLHIAIVVNDVFKAAEEWGRLLGVRVKEMNLRIKGQGDRKMKKNADGKWEIRDDQPPATQHDPRNHYRKDYSYGQSSDYDFIEADLDTKFMRIELIQAEKKGPFHEYYEKHGTGIQHIAFRVDNWEEVDAMLRKDGYETIVDTYAPNKDRWTVFDTEDVLGTNLCVKPSEKYLSGTH
jgi:catechol 2,3-dioxygenase-like lactoylglutathione lyase family enzyme